jgi:hypothetical protein
VQYVLILLHALFGEMDVRNAWMHVDWGVAGEHPREVIWGRRQCRRWRIREEGLDVIVKRALGDGWRMCGWRSLLRWKPRVAQRQTKVMVNTKLGAARSQGHSKPRPPAEMPS